MDICKGIGNWFACVGCKSICTLGCPFEKEDPIEELRKSLRAR